MGDRSEKVAINGAFCGAIRSVSVFNKDRYVGQRHEVLLIRNAKGCFELPGGGIEGELPSEAAVREMNEEAGLEVAVSKLIHIGTGVQLVPSPWISEKIDIFSNLVMLYRVIVTSGAVLRTENLDSLGTQWFTAEDLVRLARAKDKLEPDTIPVVQARMAMRALIITNRWPTEFLLRDPLDISTMSINVPGKPFYL